MDDTLMGIREARRLGEVEAALRGEISNREGAQSTGLSLRQFKRLKARVHQRGPQGLVHGNRGRPSPRRLGEPIRERIVALLQRTEVCVNDCHIRHLLADEGLTVSADTVRRIRRRLGLPAKQRRRPTRHLRRRERQARAGSMVLIDGSPFRWLGPQRPEFTLTGTVDDATGRILSLNFRPEEDLHGFTTALRDLILAYGVPGVMYGDGTSIAVRNDPYWSREEELEGRQRPSHFGQMLEELGIRYIRARTPEAKGRIERLWRTLQDRLTTELALHGITTVEAAGAFLPGFIERYNRQLARAPREAAAAWSKAPKHLDRILACRYLRTVSRDNVVSLFGTALPIPPGPHGRSYQRTQVEIRELLDGRLLVLFEGRVIAEQAAAAASFSLAPRRSARGDEREIAKIDLRRSPRIVDRPAPRVARQDPTPRRGQLTNIRRPAKNHRWKKSYNPNLLPSPTGAGG